jgi:hypothetical protein
MVTKERAKDDKVVCLELDRFGGRFAGIKMEIENMDDGNRKAFWA